MIIKNFPLFGNTIPKTADPKMALSTSTGHVEQQFLVPIRYGGRLETTGCFPSDAISLCFHPLNPVVSIIFLMITCSVGFFGN